MGNKNFSREELLSGDLNRSRRAAKLLAAIEARCTYLRAETQRVVEAYFLEGDEASQLYSRGGYVGSLKLTAETAMEALHREDLEQFAAQWKLLAPADPEMRARLIRQVHEKYAAGPSSAPHTLAALGRDDPAVQAAYQELFGAPLQEAIRETEPHGPPGLEHPAPQSVPAPGSGSAPRSVAGQMAARLEWVSLAAGEVLFEAGDPGDALYVVISGRMQVTGKDKDGQARVLVDIGRGDVLGEMAILTGEPRNATVRAARDSELVRLGREDLFAMAQENLQVLVRVSALGIHRLDRQLAGVKRASQSCLLSFALLPCDAEVPIEDFGRQLAQVLGELGATVYLTGQEVDRAIEPGAAQAGVNDLRNAQIVAWLAEVEAYHNYTIYQAEAEDSEWSRRCLRQADRVVLVGRAAAGPQPAAHEAALLAEWSRLNMGGGASGVELVLLHGANPAIAGQAGRTAPWLKERVLRGHHHVRSDSPADMGRLARRLTGRDMGLVLGGGGARGFGHIGVLRALREMNIPVDQVGGNSMGALMSAAFALGMDDREIFDLVLRTGTRKQLLDRTLPVISLYATRRITELIRRVGAGVDIEDMWLPYFCVSSNLSKGRLMVHRSGPAWVGVRASMAAAPIFTPILHEGDILVDGGFLNNLPVDVMRQQFGSAVVLGVNCSPLATKTQEYDFGPSISGWEALRYQVVPSKRHKGPPNILGGLTQIITQIIDTNWIYLQQFTRGDADLIVTLPTSRWDVLDFDACRQIVEVSYQAACEQLAGWRPECV